MRHGPAGQHGDPAYPDDAQRPLTLKGMEKSRRALRGLAQLRPPIEAVFTSPLVRARQTAELAAEAMRLPATALTVTSNLAPGFKPATLFTELTQAGHAELLLVGHEPDLSQLVSFLLTGNPEKVVVTLRKAAVCLIETDTMPPVPPAVLHFLLQPRQLRAMA